MKRIVLFTLILTLAASFASSYATDMVEGTWFGQGSALGQTTSVSASFDGVGSFSASGLGRDFGGSYTISGDRVVLSAAGLSMSLVFSSDGSGQSLSGSLTYRGITGSISLSRENIPAPAGEGDVKAQPDEVEDIFVPEDIYATWTNDDKMSYTLSLYESGFAGLCVADAEDADEKLVTTLGEYSTVADESVIAILMRDVKQNEPVIYEYPTRLQLQGDTIVLSLLSDDDPTAFKSFFTNLWDAESRQFRFTCDLNGNTLTIAGEDGKTLVLYKTAPTTEAPASEAFWRYIPVANGDRGDNVKYLQSKLIDMGLLSGKADGIFGKKTRAAVEALQKEHGLDVTGIADEATWALVWDSGAAGR